MVAYIPSPAPSTGTAIGSVETQLHGCTLGEGWMSHLAFVGDHVEVQLMTDTDLYGTVTSYVVTVFDERLEEPTVSLERVTETSEALALYQRRLGEALMNEVLER